jgi:hypothetical protein
MIFNNSIYPGSFTPPPEGFGEASLVLIFSVFVGFDDRIQKFFGH